MTINHTNEDMPERLWLGCADADGDRTVWFDPDEGGTMYIRAELLTEKGLCILEGTPLYAECESKAHSLANLWANGEPAAKRAILNALLKAALGEDAGSVKPLSAQAEAIDAEDASHGKCLECGRKLLPPADTNIDALIEEFAELDPVKPREPLRSMTTGEPNGYFESDRDWMEENRFTAVWLLENFDRIREAAQALSNQEGE